jgi:PAS domain-containing protein
MELLPLQVVPRQQFIADREFEKDPSARSILISQGLYLGCLSTLHRAGLLLSVITIYRARRLGSFSRSDIDILRRLVPHLARALRVHRHVSASQIHQHQAEEALNQLSVGLLLLAEDGRIVFANRAAEELLRQGDGIKSRDGKVVASHHLDHARLSGIIARAAGRAATPRMAQARPVDRGSGRRQLQVWIVPLPREPSSLLVRNSPSDARFSLAPDAQLTRSSPHL